MDGMRLLLSILFLILDDSDAAITIEGGSNFSAFKEENVTIPWEYDFENETFSLQWSFTNASSYTSTVMNKLGSSPAVVVGDFNIKHNSGGKITLTEVQLSNTGTYSCLVTYNPLSGHTQVTGTAVLTVSVKTTTPTQGTTTEGPEGPCWCKKWWGIVIIVVIICCLLFFCGIVIGIFKYSCKDGPCNTFYVGDRIPKWVKGLTIIIVGLGILTVYRICKGRGRFNDDSTQNEMPMKTKK